MIRLAATASIAALMLAACTPDGAEKDAPADAVGQAASAEAAPAAAPEGFPLSYIFESENYTVQSEIDPVILAFDPSLAYGFWTLAKAQLDELGVSADEGRRMADEDAEATGEDPWFMVHTLDITHKATGVFGDVISVSETVSSFSGGAHPNYFLAGGIYRKGEAEPLPLSTFVTDPAAFNDLAISALVTEKLERGFTEEPAAIEASLREMLGPTAEVSDVYKGRFVFEPSTETGKVGGISLTFSPYDIGSYAEGAYYATLSATDLAPILGEAWAPRFGGDPVMEEEEPASGE